MDLSLSSFRFTHKNLILPFLTEFYRFLHRGHCRNGHVCNTRNCNTIEATLMDCRNRCERLGKHVGYFAYVPGSTCACYTKCENDGRNQNHIAFEIMRPGILEFFF